MTHRSEWVALQVIRELRLAARRLRSAPLFTLFAVTTLALALAVTTGVYSLVDRLMGVDYGSVDRDAIFGLRSNGVPLVSLPDFRHVEREQSIFSHVAAVRSFRTSLVTSSVTVLTRGEVVTGDYFAVMGVGAMFGRALVPADDNAAAPRAVVVSAATARSWLGGEASAVGQNIRLGGQAFTVVGVMAAGFGGMAGNGSATPGFWMPTSALPVGILGVEGERGSPVQWSVSAIARLRAGVTTAAASQELRALGQRLDEAYPAPDDGRPAAYRSRNWTLEPALADRLGTDDMVRRILVGLPALVFLVACTNIANLALSRGISRRGTLAVRHALGATRSRLVREEMAETAIIAAVGGVLGLAGARWILLETAAFVARNTSLGSASILADLALSPPVVGVAVAITLLALVIGGLIPALSLTRGNLRDRVAAGSGAGSPGWRGRSRLIAVQVGVTAALFLLSLSAARSFPHRLLDSGPGLDRLATATVPFAEQGYDEARTRDTLDRIDAVLRRTPDVREVAVVAGLRGRDAMLVQSARRRWITTPDLPFSPSHEGTQVETLSGTPAMFEVLGLSLLSGRGLTSADARGAEDVVVVNAAVADAVFGTADVTGRVLMVRTLNGARPADIAMRIVGVVTTAQRDTRGAPIMTIYFSYAQHYDPNVAIVVRGSSDVPPVASLRDALRTAAPSLAPAFVGDGAVLGRIEWVMLEAGVAVSYALAALALVLAMGGLYGVLSHVVSLRAREMAVRMALGAPARQLGAMVLHDGLRPVVQGLLSAIAAAAIMRQVLRFLGAADVSAIDPRGVALASLLMLTAGAVACFLPARRAARVDPNATLKDG